MNYNRPFRYLIIMVAGMVVGTVFYRYGNNHMLFQRTSLEPLPIQPSNPPPIPNNVVQMKQDSVPSKPDQKVESVKDKRTNEAVPKEMKKDEKTVIIAKKDQADIKKEFPVKDTSSDKKDEPVKDTKIEAVVADIKKEDIADIKTAKAVSKTPTKDTKTTSVVSKTTTVSSTTEDDKLPVPRIVHYAWYSDNKLVFRFHHFISVLSAYKHIKPKKIMFWYEIEPQGPWWMEIRNRVPVIELVYRKGPTEIFGKKVNVAEHKSDIVRLEAVMKYGGIYTDLDVIITKSFDPIRKYNTTMGYELPNGLCNGIIVSAPNAPFLKIWHETYRTFNDGQWAYHSVQLPAELAKKHADLIHTEKDTMHRPNWIEKDWLYKKGKIWDWSKNYAVHLWFRFHNVDHNPEDIKTLDTTMGQLFRYTYYGTKDLIKT